MPKKGTRSRELGPNLKKNFQVPEVPQKGTRSRNSVLLDRVPAQPCQFVELITFVKINYYEALNTNIVEVVWY